MSEHMKKHFKRNYWVGVINGVLFTGGRAFLDPTTVIPEFLSYLTNSSMIIGGISTIFRSGMLLTQVFTANFIETKALKLPIYAVAAKIRVITAIIIAFSVYIFANWNSNVLLLVFMFSYIIYSFSTGLGMIPFQEVIAKTIYPHKRGSFIALRESFGGLLSILAGLLISRILRNENDFSYPLNYSLLFFIGAIIITIALIIFVKGMKEPKQKNHKKSIISSDIYFVNAFKQLRQDKRFVNLFYVRILIGTEALCMPFFIRYARSVLGMRPFVTGAFLTVQMLGRMIFALLWGRIADKKGNKLIIQFISVIGVIFTVTALISDDIINFITINFINLDYDYWIIIVYGSIFFWVGSFFAGQFIGFDNYLLEIAPEKHRPTYIGFFNSIIGLQLMVFPFLGGLLIDLISYKLVFAVVTLMMIFAFILSFRLDEPRNN